MVLHHNCCKDVLSAYVMTEFQMWYMTITCENMLQLVHGLCYRNLQTVYVELRLTLNNICAIVDNLCDCFAFEEDEPSHHEG